MPNKDVHLPVGMISGAAFAAARTSEVPIADICVRTIGGVIGGYIGARLPDIIDPATNGPNHRSIGHGIVPNACVVVALRKPYEHARHSLNAHSEQCQPIAAGLLHLLIGVMDGFVVGYASHLILDSSTPRGLPIVG